ncbi:hypothetical protein VNI00_009917 [Paramarasmius palmivorus]|uniref:Uncharacterized protein n=1 Tax=Paramarasmius palmivorus TaxID=297713 RepID=A0AAW0CN17_9AGAR
MRLSLPIVILHALCLVNAAIIPVQSVKPINEPPLHDSSPNSLSNNLNTEPLAHTNPVRLLPEAQSKALRKRQIHNADYSTKKSNSPQDNTNSTSTSSSSDSTEPQSSSGSGESRHEPREPHHFLLSKEKAQRRHSARGSRGPFMQSAPVRSGKGKIASRSMLMSFPRILSRGWNPRLWFSSRDSAVPGTASPTSAPTSSASSSLPTSIIDRLRVSPGFPSSDAVTPQGPSKRGDAKDCSSKPNVALPKAASEPLKHEGGVATVRAHSSRGPPDLALGAEKSNDPNELAKGDGSKPSAGHVGHSGASVRRWMRSEPQGTGQSRKMRRVTNGM